MQGDAQAIVGNNSESVEHKTHLTKSSLDRSIGKRRGSAERKTNSYTHDEK